MTTPADKRKAFVKYATPGVGIGPHNITSTPAAAKPASNAASNKYPEIRVSFPISTLLRSPGLASLVRTFPAA